MSILKKFKKLLIIPMIWVLFAVSSLNLPALVNNAYAEPTPTTPEATETIPVNLDDVTNPGGNPATPETPANPENPEETTEEEKSEDESSGTTCSSQIGALGWLLCPATGVLAQAIDSIYGIIENLLIVQPITMEDGSPSFVVWTYMRNLANIVFIIMFMLIIYSQITGLGISNYGIKRMLPKLIVSAILVNLSFIISSALVDISNIVGRGIHDLLLSVGESAISSGLVNADAINFNISDLFAAIAGTGIIAGIAIVANGGLVSALLMLIPVILGIFIAVLIGLLMIALRQAVIMLLVMISPLAFVCFLMPNTEKWFQKWKGYFSQMLFFFPMFSLLFGASRLAGWVIISSATDTFGIILGVAVQMMPLFLSVNLMKMSGTMLGGISNRLNALGGRATNAVGQRTNQYRNLRRSQQIARGMRRPFNPLSSASWAAFGAKRQFDLNDRQRIADKNVENLQNERMAALKRGQRIIAYDRDGKPIYTSRPVNSNRYMRAEFEAREIDLRVQATNLQTENALSQLGSYLDENNVRDARLRRLASRQGDNYLELMTQRSAQTRNARADTRFYYNQVQKAAERDDSGNLIDNEAYQKYVVRGAGVDAYNVNNVANTKAFNDSTTTVVADAYDMFEHERKATTDKYTTYFGRQVTKEVISQYEAMLRNNNIDGIVAAQNTLAVRGDYDKIGEHLRAYMDAGNVKLGTDEANVLALNLLGMKNADPFLGRLGKFINMETWAYTDGKRGTQEVTMEQFVTGKIDGDSVNPNYKTKINVATGLQGTSFKGIDRTAFGDLSSILEYYTSTGMYGENDRRALLNAIMPQLISAIPTFDSGGEQITNTVGFLTGLKYNATEDKWASTADKNKVNAYEIPRDDFAYQSTHDYLAALTPNDLIYMKTDAINSIMQRLTIEHMDPAIQANPSAYSQAQKDAALATAQAQAKEEFKSIFTDADYIDARGITRHGNGNIQKLLSGDQSAMAPMKNRLRKILDLPT